MLGRKERSRKEEKWGCRERTLIEGGQKKDKNEEAWLEQTGVGEVRGEDEDEMRRLIIWEEEGGLEGDRGVSR